MGQPALSHIPPAFAVVLPWLLQVYNGFNLVVGDMVSHQLAYLSNRAETGAQALEPGLHGISNGVLDSAWPKVEKGKLKLLDVMAQQHCDSTGKADDGTFSHEEVLSLVMSDTEKEPISHLPQTGMPLEVEQLLSPIFIQPMPDLLPGTGLYGTRSQTVLVVGQDGNVNMWERSIADAQGKQWHTVQHHFKTEPGGCNAN